MNLHFNSTQHVDILLEIEENYGYFKELIKKELEHENNRLTIIFSLTYYPNLVVQIEDYLIENNISQYFSNTGHPFLNELMEQSQILYSIENLKNHSLDIIRKRLLFFLQKLKQFAPHYFSVRGKYFEYAFDRFEPFGKSDEIDEIKKILLPT